MRDLRVLEIAGSVAASYCAKLFADVGADVVLVEPPDGGPGRRREPYLPDGRSASHLYLDAAKRSAVLDLDGPDGDAALRWADLVMVTVDGDPQRAFALRDRVRALNPAGVVVALSGFGLTGPYASWRSSALVDWASGGYLYLNGEPDRAPLQGGGPWASFVAGATAAIGAQAALMAASCTGQGDLVDVGAMESTAAGHQWTIVMYTHTGAVKRRWGLRFGEAHHPMGIYRCRDGWVFIGAPARDQWERLCLVADAPELILDESLLAPGARFERGEEIDALIQPWLSAHTAADAVRILQEHRVPSSLVQDFADVLSSEHLAERGFLVDRPDVAPGARAPRIAFAVDGGQGPARSVPPAAPGSDTDAFLAQARAAIAPRPLPRVDLAAVRVVEFTVAWAGPLAGRFLADLGATSVKVEHPASRGIGTSGRAGHIGGDPTWSWGKLPDPQIRAEVFPQADPGVRWWNRMGIWNKMNRGKQSLALDVKAPEGPEILRRLLAESDVLVHNYTPRGARSLGIDPESLLRANPRITSVAMTGYGETGPMATHSSYGPILEAHAGFDEATGYEGGGPMRIGVAFPDAVGGLHGAFAILTALWERAATDRPVHVDLSQLETLLAFAGDALLTTSVTGRAPARRGNRSLEHAPQGVYRCDGEDAWVAVTVDADAAWRVLVDLVADAELAAWRELDRDGRRAHHDAIDAALERWTAARSAGDAAAALQAAGVAACPAFTNADLVHDPQLAARGFVVDVVQDDVGPVRFPGYPIHFGRRGYQVRGAPTLGADNEATLRRLGYDDEAVLRLTSDGVVCDHPPS